MKMPVVLLILSGVGVAFGLLPDQTDALLLALPCLVASLYLVLRAFWRRPAPLWILVDGSNVLHWADGTPQLATLRAVVDHLTGMGFAPSIVLDANAGYKIGDRYQHDAAFGRMLGLPVSQVMVVGKGTPADPALLAAARDLGARIVTNDRFRDWAADYPEVARPGHLVRGGMRDGKLWLDLEGAAAPANRG